MWPDRLFLKCKSVQNITFGNEEKSDPGEMTTHGQISEFHGVPEEWTSYMERLECYFMANNVADARKQCATPLSCCGASTYSLILHLVAKQAHSHHLQGLGRESHHVFYPQKIQDCLGIQIQLVLTADW